VGADAPAASLRRAAETIGRAAADVLAGPRGIVKAIHVWWPVSLCLTAIDGAGGVLPLAVFGAAACWAEAAILCNDVADRRQDAAAGKQRWAAALPGWGGWTVTAAAALLGLALVGAAGGGPLAASVYAAAVALALAYSVPPLRLKTRGPWGPSAYAASACLAYAALPWAWTGAPAWVLAAAGPAVLLDKWVNLHFHQVIDAGADRAAGAQTFALTVGERRARRWLTRAAALASLAMAAGVGASCLAARSWGWEVAGFAVVTTGSAVLYAKWSRRRPERSALVSELPGYYLGLTTALFRVVPALLLLRLALGQPALRCAAALFAVLLLTETRHVVAYRYR
jgi:4-hydroxybenzoate polyprenyltransferase